YHLATKRFKEKKVRVFWGHPKSQPLSFSLIVLAIMSGTVRKERPSYALFVTSQFQQLSWSSHNRFLHFPLRSGMLEQGVDRIVAQVVDPKVNHIFRPQVERVVREFLSPGSCSEEPTAPLTPPGQAEGQRED
uniref:Uncharacterized protein n=1 Tax=Fundulus heteroclitus TaxID=8078 RepID=A0A3Q2QYF2_FUNHE